MVINMNNDMTALNLQVRLTEYLFNIKKFDANFIIAKIMLDKISDFPNVSIEEIAFLSNTSPSTVTKFCKKIGYLGFSQIKDEPINYSGLVKNIHSHQPKDFYFYFANLTNNLYELLYSLFNHEQIDKIAKHLSQCKKVAVFTGLHGFAATNLFNEMMRSFHITVYEVDRSAEISVINKTFQFSDLVFIISLTTDWVNHTFQQLQPNLANNYAEKSILLSYNSYITYPFYEVVDLSLVSDFFESNYISSLTLQLFFILLTSYLKKYK